MLERLADRLRICKRTAAAKVHDMPSMPYCRRNGGIAAAPWQFADSHNHVSGAWRAFRPTQRHARRRPQLTICDHGAGRSAPAPTAARAQDASAWDKQPHAQARLIAGSVIKTADATFLRAGVEIRLDPGWKTYWRDPGDSGVPPTFDFSGSRERQIGHGAVAGAGAISRRRRRQFDRLCRRRHPAAAHRRRRTRQNHRRCI